MTKFIKEVTVLSLNHTKLLVEVVAPTINIMKVERQKKFNLFVVEINLT